MNDRSGREQTIFDAALKLPVGERTVFLGRECGDDQALKARVEALLRADTEAGNFMEVSPGGTHLRSGQAIGEKPGDRIGRYRLLQQIGEGGCGVVFMAEQEAPVRRKVALKIIKPGMDTRSVIARFEAERQALALMDHPNIAKVFDAGATESGRPYFVMELIRGPKITDYCDQQSLTTAERLELFIQVCQAVQHAHQKGVIHRDIKPSNVLVSTSEQGVAHPMVIDFGIAKATTSQKLTDKTLFTAFEMLIGTPAYMSPEQAALVNVEVDTRTDIYSLGVLLYELLTGSTPFDAAKLLQAGLDEIRRVIRDVEPARPSTRLSNMAVSDLTTIAQHRQAAPPDLIHTVAGDLDWIVMKALEKDRTRRYETANGLALDIQRCLGNEPISARPPSRLYKLQKTIQRNRLLFLGLAVVTTVLLVSLATVLLSLAQERKARRAAQTGEERSRQVTQFLKNMLMGVGPSVARGRSTEMLREILDKTAQEVGGQIGNQPVVEAEMRELMGRLYLEIGNYAGAETMARATLELQRKLHGADSTEAAAALNDLGGALWKQRKLAEAETVYAEALTIRRRLSGNENADVATTLNYLGAVHRRQKRLAEAEALTREGLAIRRRLFGNEHLGVAESLRDLAIVLRDRDQRPEAEDCAREMLAIRRRLLGNEHPLVAASLTDLAFVLGNESGEAEGLETEAFLIQRNVLGDDHPDLARSLYRQGEHMRHRGELAESHAVLRAALSIQRKLLGEEHPDVLATRRSLVSLLQHERNWAELEALHRQAFARHRQRSGIEAPETQLEVEGLIRALRKQNRFAEAEQFLEGELSAASLSPAARAQLLSHRADLMVRLGRWEVAATNLTQAAGLQPENRDSYHLLAPVLAVTQNRPAYGQLYRTLLVTFTNATNPFWAERVATDCLLLPDPAIDLMVVDRLADTALALGGEDATNLPYFQVCKAMSSYRLARFQEATSWAQKIPEGAPLEVRAQACAVLAMAHWQLGRKADAAAMLAKGEEWLPGKSILRGTETAEVPWVSWLIARVILNEAGALIQSPPAKQKPEKS